MKLVELRIKNFRSIGGDQTRIQFNNSDIIFLIGQNDVGKSSVLDAYEYFVTAKQKGEKTDFFMYDESEPICFEGDFIVEPADEDDKGFKKEPDWIDKWVQKDSRLITVKKECTKAGTEFVKSTKNTEGVWIEGGFGGFDTIFSKHAPQPVKINAIETSESLEKKVNDIIEKEITKKLSTTHKTEYEAATKALQTLQDIATSAEIVDGYNTNINESFKKVFPQLKLKISVKDPENIDVPKAIKSSHSIDVVKDGVERKELFSQHGHGVIRQALFNFVAFLKTVSESKRKEYLILFEEPELFLHPKSERLLREQLYSLVSSSPFQMMCATHSGQMIDISKPHSSLVRIVKNLDETVVTHQVGHDLFQSDEMKNFVQMINRFNPHVCETFYATNVLIVEGDTESIVCREYLAEFFPSEDIFVLNAGSKNNIPFFQNILNHFGIDYGVIHDSDTRLIYQDRDNGITKNKKSGEPKANSAWAINDSIQAEIDNATTNIAMRWVSIFDFESENGYRVDLDKGKPLSAYDFYQANKANELPIFKKINDFLKKQNGATKTLIDAIVEPST